MNVSEVAGGGSAVPFGGPGFGKPETGFHKFLSSKLFKLK